MVVGHQPCDRSFHHRSPATVVLGEVALFPHPSGFDQFFVVRMEAECTTVFGSGAPFSEGTSVATNSEHGGAASGDGDRVAGGAGSGACFLIHDEVLLSLIHISEPT